MGTKSIWSGELDDIFYHEEIINYRNDKFYNT